MKKNLNWLFALVLVTSTLVLTGCGGGGAQTPTLDPVAIYTQVAQTVQAQVTNNAKTTPKASNTPLPTETQSVTNPTLRPSSTPFGTLQATVPTSLTPVKTGTVAKTGTAGTLPPASTATLAVALGTQPAVTSADKMLYVSQSPTDGATFSALQGFTMKWVLKNIGTTTWDNTYTVRLYAGPSFGANGGPLGQTVKPNGQATISLDMRAPDTQGEYTTVWVITAPDGHNFGSFTLTLKVK
jgi:hypothetical protein